MPVARRQQFDPVPCSADPRHELRHYTQYVFITLRASARLRRTLAVGRDHLDRGGGAAHFGGSGDAGEGGEVAGDPVFADPFLRHIAPFGHLLLADVLRQPTARVEAAAGG